LRINYSKKTNISLLIRKWLNELDTISINKMKQRIGELKKMIIKYQKENHSESEAQNSLKENNVLNENSCLDKSRMVLKKEEYFPKRLHSYYASSEL